MKSESTRDTNRAFRGYFFQFFVLSDLFELLPVLTSFYNRLFDPLIDPLVLLLVATTTRRPVRFRSHVHPHTSYGLCLQSLSAEYISKERRV